MRNGIGEVELAYLAGMFDGEGSIFIVRQTPKGLGIKHYLRIKIEMANPYIPPLFAEHFGGIVHKRDLRPRYQLQHGWQLCSREAYNFLKIMCPYLRLKKDEAQLGIEFQEKLLNSRNTRPVSDEMVNLRESYRAKMKVLKNKSNYKLVK